MEPEWAAEHLQTIRTLMERTALYRRALAPIMTFTGILGVAGAIVAFLCKVDSPQAFVVFWAAVGFACLAGSFLLVRRQALKDAEPFWSPPTRRVTLALIPPFVAGAVVALPIGVGADWAIVPVWGLPICWMLFYGCALSAAGFFMIRGIKLLGWIFVGAACALIAIRFGAARLPTLIQCHEIMGAGFGGLHLACGIYLYFTEQGKNAA